MNRRELLASVAFLAAAGAMGGAFYLATESDGTENSGGLPQVLDSSTLAQYPDSKETVEKILASPELRGKLVVVDFGAGWCPHCARLKPELNAAITNLQAAGANIARLTVVYQEGDHRTGQRGAYAYRDTFRDMTRTNGFPEVHIVKDGELIGGFSGAHPREAIQRYLETLMAPQTPAPGQAPAANPG